MNLWSGFTLGVSKAFATELRLKAALQILPSHTFLICLERDSGKGRIYMYWYESGDGSIVSNGFIVLLLLTHISVDLYMKKPG